MEYNYVVCSSSEVISGQVYTVSTIPVYNLNSNIDSFCLLGEFLKKSSGWVRKHYPTYPWRKRFRCWISNIQRAQLPFFHSGLLVLPLASSGCLLLLSSGCLSLASSGCLLLLSSGSLLLLSSGSLLLLSSGWLSLASSGCLLLLSSGWLSLAFSGCLLLLSSLSTSLLEWR